MARPAWNIGAAKAGARVRSTPSHHRAWLHVVHAALIDQQIPPTSLTPYHHEPTRLVRPVGDIDTVRGVDAHH
jgi:hypothetical protein